MAKITPLYNLRDLTESNRREIPHIPVDAANERIVAEAASEVKNV
jgi:hypothetical protein